jgi:hypothetical protein
MQLTNSNTNWPVIDGKTIDIAALRAKDFSVIVNSFRLVDMPYLINCDSVMIPVPIPTYEIRRKNLQNRIRARGGYTTVKITKPGLTVIGEAITHPDDSFCKGVGVKIALKKAVDELVKSGVSLA